MEKLLKKVHSLGWYSGELNIQIGIKQAFEGFSGRASETWETVYTFNSNEIKNIKGDILFPKLSLQSQVYEPFEIFIEKIEALL